MLTSANRQDEVEVDRLQPCPYDRSSPPDAILRETNFNTVTLQHSGTLSGKTDTPLFARFVNIYDLNHRIKKDPPCEDPLA